jgi:glycosyltransferase involved in cell wall biosynthesis
MGMGWFPEQGDGLNRFYFDLIKQLSANQISLRGLVAGSDKVLEESNGLVTGFTPRDKNLLARWKGARREATHMLRESSFDLVASHFALYTFPLLNIVKDLPLVVHFQGPWSAEGMVEGGGGINGLAKALIEKSVYKRAQRCIVLSKAFADILSTRFGINEDIIRVVPGGVDIERYASTVSLGEARQSLGWPDDRPVVLVVRRLAKRMGLENLIEAVVEIRRHIPDILVMIAGRGAIQSDLERQIRERSLEHHVRLLGFVDDDVLPLAYRAADLTVVPTIALEGFGLITLESLASGTPVLVSPVGGLPETVAGLSEDLILPGFDITDIALGIRSALDGSMKLPDEQACVEYVTRNFSWNLITSRIIDIYKEALH